MLIYREYNCSNGILWETLPIQAFVWKQNGTNAGKPGSTFLSIFTESRNQVKALCTFVAGLFFFIWIFLEISLQSKLETCLLGESKQPVWQWIFTITMEDHHNDDFTHSSFHVLSRQCVLFLLRIWEEKKLLSLLTVIPSCHCVHSKALSFYVLSL